MKDDDGFEVGPGDWISFSYGLPPVGVRAKVSTENGKLKFTCLGRHSPKTGSLSTLGRHVGNWYKADGPGHQL